MAIVIVSTTEPKNLRNQPWAITSTAPEEFGCDVLVFGEAVTVGIQRKAVPDLIASMGDGRLSEQQILMEGLSGIPMVVIEGPLSYDHNDNLVYDSWGRSVSKKVIRRTMMSLRLRGVAVEYAQDLKDTIEWIELIMDWADSHSHSTFRPRVTVEKGDWGERRIQHYRKSILMCLPGIGDELATRILEQGWPLRLVEDLSEIPGVGPKKLAKIMEVLVDE